MEWNNKISENVQAVPFSGIRKFFDLASTMKDVISLGVGEPDYAAPDRVIDACIESLKNKETSIPRIGVFWNFARKSAAFLKSVMDWNMIQ